MWRGLAVSSSHSLPIDASTRDPADCTNTQGLDAIHDRDGDPVVPMLTTSWGSWLLVCWRNRCLYYAAAEHGREGRVASLYVLAEWWGEIFAHPVDKDSGRAVDSCIKVVGWILCSPSGD